MTTPALPVALDGFVATLVAAGAGVSPLLALFLGLGGAVASGLAHSLAALLVLLIAAA